MPDLQIAVPHSGSLATATDADNEVLFVYDTINRRLSAVSIAVDTWGDVIDTMVLNTSASSLTDIGDMVEIDPIGMRAFVTGGDGGAVVAVEYDVDGQLGAELATGRSCRSTGNSGGGVAVDSVGRRIFTFANNATLRVFDADPPFDEIELMVTDGFGGSDNGLVYYPTTGQIFAGRTGNTDIRVYDPATGANSLLLKPALDARYTASYWGISFATGTVTR